MKINAAEKSFDEKLFKVFLIFVIIILSIAILLTVPSANAQTDGSSETIVVSDTIQSIQDPGLGHQTHQLAIILDQVDYLWYNGTISFNASEPIQIVELDGPLKDFESAGPTIWTSDGSTMFNLTLIDLEQANGNWTFYTNALALHTMNKEPFNVTYTVEYNLQSTDNKIPVEKVEQIELESVKETENIVTPMENINATEDIEVKEGSDDVEETENIEEKEIILPPRQQVKLGISPDEVVCKDGLGLIFKASNNQPACVFPSTAIILIERGWTSSETI